MTEAGVPDRTISRSSAHDDSALQRHERDRQRLTHARASLERLCLELRQDLQESERGYACAMARIRLLLRDAERRDREYADARRHVRLLLKDAERRDREFAHVRAQLRSLKHLSAGLATAFLAITATRRWRLGNALLLIPSRLLGRRTVTVADDQHELATTLALGQVPQRADSNEQDVHPGVGDRA